MPDLTLRKTCIAIENDTRARLVLETFQGDSEKNLDVCRALSSLWIHAGIKGGNAYVQLQSIARLDSKPKQKLAQQLHEQQGTKLFEVMQKLEGTREIAQKLVKVESSFKKVTDALTLGGKREVPEHLSIPHGAASYDLDVSCEDYKAVVDDKYSLFADALSLGAQTRGTALADFGAPKKLLTGKDLRENPSNYLKKNGFYYIGLGSRHALSVYFESEIACLYDANTGLWIHGGLDARQKFVPTYFASIYGKTYDAEQVQLLLYEVALSGDVKATLKQSPSILGAYRSSSSNDASCIVQ